MMPIIEIIILGLIFVFSIILIHKSFDSAVKVLLILSVLLHKEVFSIYQWDYLPVRFFMLGLLIYGLARFITWYWKSFDIKKIYEVLQNPFFVLLGLLWLIRLFSIINSKNLSASILILGFFTTILFLGYFLWQHLNNNQQKSLDYIKYYILLLFGLSIFGYFQLALYQQTGVIIGALWNVPGHIARVGSTFWDVNHFGALLAMLLPVFGVLIITEGTLKQKIIRSLMFLIMTVTLILTSSRTAWISAAVSFGAFISILLLQRFGKKGVLTLLAVIMLVSTLGLIEFSDKASPFRAYIKQNFHYRLDSFASHIYLLTGSYQIFEEHPFIGGGYGSFFEHFRTTKISSTFFSRDPAALNTRVPAHTIWGELIAETGILGLTTFIAFIVVVVSPLLYNTFNSDDLKTRLLSTSMLAAIFGVLTAGIFYSYNSEFFWIILFLYFVYGVASLPKEVALVESLKRLLEAKGFLLGVIGVISIFLIFINLGTTHLIPWDEAIYAKIAKNMVLSDEYINMEWQPKTIWYEKPPLSIWLEAGMMKIFGFESFGVRLPSAIFGLLTVLLTYFFAKKLFSKGSAFISALALVTTVHFLQYSRYAMLDVTLTFFITLTLYLYWVAKEKEKTILWTLSGIAAGLGIMTKGVVGFLPLVVIGLNELSLLFLKEQKLNSVQIKKYFAFGITCLLVFLPWHLEMYRRFGPSFINNYLIYHVFDRAREAIEDKGQPWYWYFIVLRVSMRIWFVALLSAFPFTLFFVFKKSKRHIFLVIWAIVLFAFFSAAKSKVVWYIIPLYPVLSIIVGNFINVVLEFAIAKIKLLRFNLSYHLALYILAIFAIGYLFFNKDLVYTTDLDGSKARLLLLKDKELGTDSLFYIHSIEEPLILYYTNSPFAGFDLSVEKGRVPKVSYDQQLILLTKRGRFPGYDVSVYGKLPKVVGEDGDYILWYYDSDKELDRDELNELEKQIAVLEHSDQAVLKPYLARKQYLEQRIESNGALPATN